MGLLGKLKNIFYDEEIIEVEEPKKEERPRIEEVKLPKREEVIVEKPIVREEPKDNYSEREIFKTEAPSFKFPMIEEEEVVKPRTRVNAYEERTVPKRTERETNRYADLFKEKTEVKTAPKVFKPSPVISPVYGVLDKNYSKEEIIERQETIPRVSKDVNYDDVRRKAYGTLEDELENTLSRLSASKEEYVHESVVVEDEKSIEDLLNEIEGNRNLSIGEIEDRLKDEIDNYNLEEEIEEKVEEPIYVDEPEEEEEVVIDYDKTLEHDLFNLIDSMYEDKEGE